MNERKIITYRAHGQMQCVIGYSGQWVEKQAYINALDRRDAANIRINELEARIEQLESK